MFVCFGKVRLTTLATWPTYIFLGILLGTHILLIAEILSILVSIKLV